jgi:hypothetical protein
MLIRLYNKKEKEASEVCENIYAQDGSSESLELVCESTKVQEQESNLASSDDRNALDDDLGIKVCKTIPELLE